MKVRIKYVDGAEWREELLDLQKQCLPDCTLVEPAEGDWWIGFDGNVPVAFACLSTSSQYYNVGYLSRSGVLPAYRGLGLQKRLIRARERRAKRYGFEWLRSDTRDNPPSSNNLIACGFRVFKPAHPWGHLDAIYWRKRIAA